MSLWRARARRAADGPTAAGPMSSTATPAPRCWRSCAAVARRSGAAAVVASGGAAAGGADRGAGTKTVGGIEHRVGHIVEDPAGIARLIDVEVPTEYYYEKYREDIESRHPRASKEIVEHMVSLVVFLDTSIMSRFSFGSAKATICVTTGKVL